MARGGSKRKTPDTASEGSEGSSHSRFQERLGRFLKRNRALLPSRDTGGGGLVQLLGEVELRGYSCILIGFPVVKGKRLSPKERKVAVLALFGYSDKEIGVAIGTKTSTVTTHLRRIYRKLGIHSRAGILRVALRYGILGPRRRPRRRQAYNRKRIPR